jgi:molybdate transport system permease protein
MTRRKIRQRAPWPLLVLGSLGAAVFVLPLIGLATRTPWSRLRELVMSDVVVDALKLSLMTSVLAAAISLLLGVPLAWLLFALGRRGVIGEPINDATGFLLPFSVWGVVVANVFVAMPFLVVTVEGALRNVDGRHEAAAATLGASRLTVFRRITLPMIAPSVRAGLVLAWARALGEFGATVTFAGNLQGRTQTLPLAVFVALEQDRDTAVAISLVLVAVSLAVLLLLRDRWWSNGADL